MVDSKNLHKICNKMIYNLTVYRKKNFIILSVFKHWSQFSMVQTTKKCQKSFFFLYLFCCYSVLHNLKGLPGEYGDMTYFTPNRFNNRFNTIVCFAHIFLMSLEKLVLMICFALLFLVKMLI